MNHTSKYNVTVNGRMNPKEKAALLAFMSIIFAKFHPNYPEYPWEAMGAASDGTRSLDGTAYEGTYMAEAFNLRQAITDFIEAE